MVSVDFQVGRTGAVTPVANLTPVLLAGTTVKRASLHNADVIASLDIRCGDTVKVEKGGEIIPKIVGVVTDNRPADAIPFRFASHCPECGTTLIRREGEAAWYCPNETGCPPQIRGKLEHFISRKAMNMESLGEGKIGLLFEKSLVTNSADLFDLTYDKLLGLEKSYPAGEDKKEKRITFQDKTVQNILKALESARQVPFSRVLFALGIRYVGETVAKKLAKAFGSFDRMAGATEAELTDVEEIGTKIAQSIRQWLGDPSNQAMVDRLKAAGLQFSVDTREQEVLSSLLAGKTFVVSGVFENMSREEVKQLIESNGGKVSGSVSAKTSFLVAGDNMGPEKRKRSEQLNIPIISLDDLLVMVH